MIKAGFLMDVGSKSTHYRLIQNEAVLHLGCYIED